MLTPEYLNLIEFNDVVRLYEKLNIDITVDIIKRVSAENEITETTRNQMKILAQTNGDEVFNEVLEKTSMLTGQTKDLLKNLYQDMAKEDLQGYEELYQYRNKPFKLSKTQYKILNQGMKQTNRLLKNFTNTIAFQSKQTYVNAIDEAYMQVASGAFDYSTAISQAVQKLADKGITLKDKAGRNVQLETAVRRNVLTGIQQTANTINRDIEKDLGCNGYEVSAHIGARPSHARYQGLQFAEKKEDAKKYGVMWWGKEVDSEMGTEPVSELWNDYNCRHSYFGIILGISEPVYTKKELKQYKNAKVKLNGKKVPYYEATQKQRQLENAIRKQKKTIQILENAGVDSKVQKSRLVQLQKNYENFNKETGLDKDYSRLQVANLKLNDIDKNALKKYSSSDYYSINEKLRNNQELTRQEEKLRDDLDVALTKLPRYDGLVTRSLDFFNEEDLKKFIEEHKIDNEINYKAYTSTTYGSRYNYKSQVELYINSTKARNLGEYNKSEQEALYERNSKFKVKKVEYLNSTYHILMEEIND